MAGNKKLDSSDSRSAARMHTVYSPLADHATGTSPTGRQSRRTNNPSKSPSDRESNEQHEIEEEEDHAQLRSTHREGSYASPEPNLVNAFGRVGSSAGSATPSRIGHANERASPASPSPYLRRDKLFSPEPLQAAPSPAPVDPLRGFLTPRSRLGDNPFANARTASSDFSSPLASRADRESSQQSLMPFGSAQGIHRRNPPTGAVMSPRSPSPRLGIQPPHQSGRRSSASPNGNTAQRMVEGGLPSPHPPAHHEARRDRDQIDAKEEGAINDPNAASHVENETNIPVPPTNYPFIARLIDRTIEFAPEAVQPALFAGHQVIRESRYAKLIYIASGVVLGAGVVYIIVVVHGSLYLTTSWKTPDAAVREFEEGSWTEVYEDLVVSGALQKAMEDHDVVRRL
ncbi:hypothetical protein SVAN01_04945 [Stagonosporopsis vannaccii]|nr:hypothetical protein SVAN01_04945 [Stagonosporopsis vannaccii]